MKSSANRTAASPRTRVRADVPDLHEDHLGYLLKRLQHSIRQTMDEALRKSGAGLSFAHVATLFGVSHHPGVSGAQIAKRAMVTAQTINAILHRLEAEGSVERRPHPDNRRVDRWYITDTGRAQMHRAKTASDPVWASMLALFSESEMTQLRSLLKRCIEGLERNRTEGGAACGDDHPPPRAVRTRRGPAVSTRK